MTNWADLRFRVKRFTLDSLYSLTSNLWPTKWDVIAVQNEWLKPRDLKCVDELEEVPRQIFVLWTGSNALSPNRAEALETIKSSQSICKVIWVTAETIPQFEVPGNPYHPNWQSLSLVHRADYLRCYLMHHYGGGYVDLKRLTADWSSVFDRFDEEPNLWAIGYPEVSSTAVAEVGGLLGLVLRRNYRKLIGNGAFIFRPHTPLTAEWLAEVERRIDLHSKELRLSPGNERGNNSGYPVRWTEILGEVLAPLVLKYNEHIESTKTIRPDFKRYL